jgi:phosphatidylglycerophosphatase C
MDHVHHPVDTRTHIQKEKTVNRGIAFFDFDGTITTKDTLLEIIKYQKGSGRFYLGFILLSPWLLAMKLKLISNSRAKVRVLRHFFRNEPLQIFQQKCDAFIKDRLSQLVRPLALEAIREHQARGHEVVVVSASAENWVCGWCHKIQMACIGSRMETRNGVLTGNLDGPNCNGPEKSRRILELYSLSDYDEIYCYGDTKGDKPMLELATFAYFKPFRN